MCFMSNLQIFSNLSLKKRFRELFKRASRTKEIANLFLYQLRKEINREYEFFFFFFLQQRSTFINVVMYMQCIIFFEIEENIPLYFYTFRVVYPCANVQ